MKKQSQLPWFKFFPSDWLNDPGLKLCSLAAQGLWMRMLCVMHGTKPYGHLVVAGKPVTDARQVAALTGGRVEDVARWLKELERHGVFSRATEGTIVSRRFVHDEEKRAKDLERKRRKALADLGIEASPTPAVLQEMSPISAVEVRSQKSEVRVVRSSEPSPTLPAASGERGVGTARRKGQVNGHDHIGKRIAPDMPPPDEWLAWGARVYGVQPHKIAQAFVAFRDYWCDIPGERGYRVDWFPTFKNRLKDLREKGKL